MSFCISFPLKLCINSTNRSWHKNISYCNFIVITVKSIFHFKCIRNWKAQAFQIIRNRFSLKRNFILLKIKISHNRYLHWFLVLIMIASNIAYIHNWSCWLYAPCHLWSYNILHSVISYLSKWFEGYTFSTVEELQSSTICHQNELRYTHTHIRYNNHMIYI